MAHSKSAEKRYRQSLRRRERNVAVRSLTRTAVRRALTAIETEPASAEEALRRATSVLDRAAKKGVLHPGHVARRKSRLAARHRAALAAGAAPPEAAPKRRRAAAGAAPRKRAAASRTRTKATAKAAEAPAAEKKKAPARRGLRVGRKKAEE